MRRLLTPTMRVLLGVVLLVLYLVPLGQASSGIHERRLSHSGHPMTLLLPDPELRAQRHAAEDAGEADGPRLEQPDEPLPAVIVLHGTAGARPIMAGYGYTLAHAGYAVVLVDLPGHGRNRQPFVRGGNAAAIDAARELLLDQPEVDGTRIGLLGHSMGAGAALDAAWRRPERFRAVVAVSPVPADVSPATPRNLQLQAGTWEPRFRSTARALLEEAGGPSDDFGGGSARELREIRAAEHISILFRPSSHAAARRWLDAAFDYRAAGVHRHTDWRLAGWLLHVGGWLLIVSSLRVTHRREPSRETRLIRRPLQWLGLIAASLLATGALILVAPRINLAGLGGILVGGPLAAWFLVAGTLYLVIAYRAGLPSAGDVGRGLGLFAFLWLAFGASGQLAWANWIATPERLWRWPLFALACTPWFTAVEIGQGDPRRTSRWLWLAAQVMSVGLSLFLLARALSPEVPGLGLVVIVLPLLPPYFALFVYMGSRVRRPWACGIGAGAFFGWILAVAFPAVL